jgi:5'-3' exonuclease
LGGKILKNIDKIVKDLIAKSGPNLVAIDGSLLGFRCSAAGEKRDIEATHRASGNKKVFDNITAFKKFIVETNLVRVDEDKKPFQITDFDIEDRQHPPEIAQSLHILKEMVNYIINSCDTEDYVIVLDAAGDTFRHELATVQKYKGQRDGKVKPVNLQAVKDHMILYYNTIVAPQELEADDVINIFMYEGAIGATFDKDTFGTRGRYFDFRKETKKEMVGGELVDVTRPLMTKPYDIQGFGSLNINSSNKVKGYGRVFLYFQVLSGDEADNYKPSKLSKKRFGEKGAYDILSKCTNDKEAIQAIVSKYKEWYPKPVTYTSWRGDELTRDWTEILQEYFDLAHMRRWADDKIVVKDMLTKLGISCESLSGGEI